MRSEELEMKNDKREVKNEIREDWKVAPDNKLRKILLAFLILNFSFLICTCATTSAATVDSRDRVAVRGGKAIAMDIPGSVKSICATFDPIFQKNLKPRAAVAIFPMSTEDMKDSDMIGEQLNVNLVDKYLIVEKRKIDALLDEYDFQKSGEVGVLTIGELLEADVAIIGSITGKGQDRQMVLIAVDVAKRQTLAVAKEKL